MVLVMAAAAAAATVAMERSDDARTCPHLALAYRPWAGRSRWQRVRAERLRHFGLGFGGRTGPRACTARAARSEAPAVVCLRGAVVCETAQSGQGTSCAWGFGLKPH